MKGASVVRSGLLLDGKLLPSTRKEARSLAMFLQCLQLAKRPVQQVPDEDIQSHSHLTNCTVALLASQLLAARDPKRKPKVKRFRIPLRLP